ncbi:unknown [Bacteroides sp. CAG:927]|nr:unknown [Bacteroides sp. CAG:927]
MEGRQWLCAGLRCRRAVTARSPRLASEFLWVSVSANSALRAPQAVVNKPRVPRSPGIVDVKWMDGG